MTSTTPTTWRKRPVAVEAMRLDGTWEQAARVHRWVSDDTAMTLDEVDKYPALAASTKHDALPVETDEGWCLDLLTLEGSVRADVGDYVIRGVQGEHYPCKPDIFAETYEPA